MVKIVNTTLTVKFKYPIQLEVVKKSPFVKQITKKHTRPRLKNSFSVVQWTKPNTRETIMIHANGSTVILGCKSFDQGKTVSSWLLTELPSNEISESLKQHNIVAHGRFNTTFKIPETLSILRSKGRHVMYEPELSAPIKYHIERATCLIFRNGKLILTGVKTEIQLDELIATLESDLGLKLI